MVSQETFEIVSCDNCAFKFTQPIPELKDLGNYYESVDYISHSDENKNIISRIYYLVRNYTLQKKLKLVSSYVSKGKILDYGCGTGKFLDVCRQKGWETTGVEPDSGARELASKHGTLVYGDKSAINQDQKFDVISLWHVLEHVSDLNPTLEYFSEKLQKNGRLIIAVPNYKSHDAAYYGSFWAAYDVPRHLYHFDKTSISQLLDKHGFELEHSKPMKFDSFYVSMLSERYKNGSISYLKAFWRGLVSNLNAGVTGDYSSLIYVFKPKS
jgi:2-polyprenyl-3-methyl-5-hydroxy-6-metoxy-1,4-benzoquinol methylase